MSRLQMIIIVSVSLIFCWNASAENPMEELEKEMGTVVMVEMKTSAGLITLALFPDKAPITVENFLKYTEEEFYDGTIFHRVIDNFMIQGGGLTPDLNPKKPHEPIKNEADNGLKNNRGTIAMARTGVVDSATCQFFINLKDNDFLNHKDNTATGYGYAVFGKVIQGIDVVDKIRSVKTGSKSKDPEKQRGILENVPVETVLIQSVRVKK